MLSAPSTLARLAGLLLLCGATPSALALRPRATSPCDYYAQKTVGGNTAADQTTLMALVLHSALLGPFSKYNNVSVPNFVGALTPTMWGGRVHQPAALLRRRLRVDQPRWKGRGPQPPRRRRPRRPQAAQAEQRQLLVAARVRERTASSPPSPGQVPWLTSVFLLFSCSTW